MDESQNELYKISIKISIYFIRKWISNHISYIIWIVMSSLCHIPVLFMWDGKT